ncbi:MAG TPA: ABC transporter substrate-binding protein [Bacillota bacterium]
MRWRRMGSLATILIAALLLVACGGSEPAGTPGGSSPAGGSDEGEQPAAGEKVLYIGSAYDIVSMDPAKFEDVSSRQVAFNIHAQLVQYKPGTAELEPGLAESWEVSEDGKVYRFTLRENAVFQKGYGPVTVEDVQFSLMRLIDPEVASSYAPQMQSLQEVRKVDDRTFEIVLSEPNPSFLYVLAFPEASIVPQRAVEELGPDFGSNPVGAGPFMLEEWVPQSQIVMVRNPDYWGPAPKLDKVVWRVIPEASTRYSAFDSGDVQLIQVTDPDRLGVYENQDGVEIHRAAAFNTRVIGFNTTTEPLDDIRVRQAIVHGFNVESLLTHVLPGISERAYGPFAPNIVGYNSDLPRFEYDPERARQLLAEAGYPDGFSIRMVVPNIDRFITPATVFQQDMAQIGINVEMDILDTGAALETFGQGQAPIFTFSRTHNPVPVSIAASWFHSSALPPGSNYSFMQVPEVDQLIDQARSATSEEALREIMPALQQAVVEQVNYIWIDHEYNIYATRDGVSGFQSDPFRAMILREVSVE